MVKEHHTNKTGPSAKVVDSHLILSLPDAVDPVVWRMDLRDARAAALEVRDKNERAAFIMKNGDKHEEIALYPNREKAVAALMCASDALQNAAPATQTAPYQAAVPPAGSAMPYAPAAAQKTGGGWKWLLVVALIIVGLLFFVMTSRIAPVDYSGALTASQQGPAPDNLNAGNGSSQNGVPQSADEYLSGY